MQVGARPSSGQGSAERRPIRIVAPTASGRRWRRIGHAAEPAAGAVSTALGPVHFAVFRAAFEPR